MRAAMILVALAACFAPAPPEGAPCATNSQCPEPLQCIGNACRSGAVPGDDSAVDGPVSDALLGDAPFDAPIDAPIDAPAGCSPTGFTCAGGYTLNACSGQCFIRCNNIVTHPEARSRCAAWGGTLAALDTTAANTCANKIDTPSSWIGLAQQSGTTPAGGWTWNGGAAVSFTAWMLPQPDDVDGVENGQEDCGIAGASLWQDAPCGGSFGFICRR